MEIFDVTQTDPSLLVSDSMGIHYSMDDQVEKLVKIVKFSDTHRCYPTTAYLACATLRARVRLSPRSLGGTPSRASGCPRHPGGYLLVVILRLT